MTRGVDAAVGACSAAGSIDGSFGGEGAGGVGAVVARGCDWLWGDWRAAVRAWGRRVVVWVLWGRRELLLRWRREGLRRWWILGMWWWGVVGRAFPRGRAMWVKGGWWGGGGVWVRHLRVLEGWRRGARGLWCGLHLVGLGVAIVVRQTRGVWR